MKKKIKDLSYEERLIICGSYHNCEKCPFSFENVCFKSILDKLCDCHGEHKNRLDVFFEYLEKEVKIENEKKR